MTVYTIWPFFACIAVLMALAATPLFRAIDIANTPHGERVGTLDGLRGFLALSVFFHHAAIYHAYLQRDAWELPPSRFYALLGQVGVAMFFMITGYLFWGKMLKDRGKPDFAKLYVGRVFRIGPLYVIAVFALVAIVFSRTGLRLDEPAFRVAKELTKWFTLGLFRGGPEINGYADTRNVVAGVTWTLQLEWWFYLSLMPTAFVARIGRYQVAVWALALLACVGLIAWQGQPGVTAPTSVCAAFFLVGMLSAALQKYGRVPRLPPSVASVAVLGLVGSIFCFFSSENMAAPILLLGAAFVLIIAGGDVFGLLTCKAAQRLGEMSYGIYLLQGLVLALVFYPESVRAFALASAADYWLMMVLCGATLVIVAGLAHVVVERPGIAVGRNLAARLPKPVTRFQSARATSMP